MIDLKTNYFNWRPEGFPKIVFVEAGQGDEVTFRKTYIEKLSRPFTVRAIDFFFGHDRGDCFEMDVTVYGDEKYLARRIEEGDDTHSREAAKWILLANPERIVTLTIFVTCRVTGASKVENYQHPSYRKWRGNFDLNLVFVGAQ